MTADLATLGLASGSTVCSSVQRNSFRRLKRRHRTSENTREERAPNMNDGSKDMGSSPNNVTPFVPTSLCSIFADHTVLQILLVRNLDPLTNEVHLATKFENLDDAARERTRNAQGPKKIILIKDRESNLSWGFAFVIFPDIDVRMIPVSISMHILWKLIRLLVHSFAHSVPRRHFGQFWTPPRFRRDSPCRTDLLQSPLREPDASPKPTLKLLGRSLMKAKMAKDKSFCTGTMPHTVSCMNHLLIRTH